MTIYYRYSEWDGTQELPDLDPEALMDQLSDNLMSYSDLPYSLRMMWQGGLRQHGQRLPGVQDLLQQLRALRRQQLERYNLGSLMEDLQKRLDEVLRKERQGLEQRLEETAQRLQQAPDAQKGAEEAAEGASPTLAEAGSAPSPTGSTVAPSPASQALSPEDQQRLLKALEERLAKKREFLDNLPPDLGGAVQELTQYEFVDSEAHQEFQELLQMLQRAVLESFFRDLSQHLQGLTPQDLERLQQMARELNRLLEERQRGGEPDFDQFMEQFGDLFQGMNPQSLEELAQAMQRQMAMMQSLLDSLPAEMRQQLQDLFEAKLMNSPLAEELARLAANLERLYPSHHQRRQYPFQGDESLTLQEAMRLMQQLQQIDALEKQMEKIRLGANIDTINAERLRELLGDEAAAVLDRLQHLTRILEEMGYIHRKGEHYELTPRGIRHIGQKALGDIFAHLKRDHFGHHNVDLSGAGGESTGDTKPYQFGDPFMIHLQRTIMNALFRQGAAVPVRLKPQDFEVEQTELVARSAIVLMLDLSWSMVLRGNFLAAKKVALALSSLIRSQFPKDGFYVVGFSDYARELKAESLPYLSSNEAVYGTNMQHGLIIAQKLLAKQKGGNKQIIMITDGEPTAYIENGQSYFEYPPTPIIFRETLREVKRCTQAGVVINTFMLDRSEYLREFVNQLTKINRGRAFYTTADNLGEYILVDYLKGKRTKFL